MTQKRTGPGWRPADDYGRSLPRFTVNLLVRDVKRSVPFYRDVLGATVQYADEDFAALQIAGTDFMLHADHAYDHHPLHTRLGAPGPRGTGAEIRVMQTAADFPHGWRDVMLEDPDGYIWAVGVARPKQS
jgi:catechol 2,3-dioxygenase-like lactoylglutathione lyase family enzyme